MAPMTPQRRKTSVLPADAVSTPIAAPIAREHLHLQIINTGNDESPALFDDAIASGAAAYVTRRQAATDFRTAVREAVRGDSPQRKGGT
jgi:DNA-binding NarL/FixJ family response regulator